MLLIIIVYLEDIFWSLDLVHLRHGFVYVVAYIFLGICLHLLRVLS